MIKKKKKNDLQKNLGIKDYICRRLICWILY